MKFRKKPVEIEAIQWDGSEEKARELIEWMGNNSTYMAPLPDDIFPPTLLIITLEGAMSAKANDWIIKGVKGEFYPCKPDIFEQTYEEVREKRMHSCDIPGCVSCGNPEEE